MIGCGEFFDSSMLLGFMREDEFEVISEQLTKRVGFNATEITEQYKD